MRRRFLSAALALCLLASFAFTFMLPASAQKEAIDVTHLFDAKIYTDGSATLPYRIYLPTDYDPAYTYPLIFFFHGAGERGNDNVKQLKNAIGQMFAAPDSPVYGCIVVAPQCPAGKQWVNVPSWGDSQYSTDEIAESEELKLVLKLLDELKDTYSIDSDCIYATGLSMGGYATWDLLVRHTDLFAAGIPVCGGADYRYAQKLKDVPIYTFHGLQDPTVPYRGTEKMVNEIRAAGGEKINYVTYPAGNHFIWEDAFSTEGLYDWLLTKRLSDRSKEETESETETEALPTETLTETETEAVISPDTQRETEETTAAAPEAEVTAGTEAETENPAETEPQTEEEAPQESETEAVASSATDTVPETETESIHTPSDEIVSTEENPTEAVTNTEPAETPSSPPLPIAPIVGATAAAVAISVISFIVIKRKK